MFWGFLLRLWIGAFIAPFAFSLVLAPLLWLAGRTMRRDEARPSLLTYPVIVVTAAAQWYFWGLWAAYCAALVVARTAHPEVTHTWLYYAVAVQSVLTPIAYLAAKERASAQSQREIQGITSGTLLYSGVAIVAFVVFVFWPGLMRVPYGWAIDAPGAVVQEAEKDDPLTRVLEPKYLADLDAWVARGPVFREGEKVDDAAVKARVQPVVETCGKLVMLTATAKEKTAFLTTDRAEFDFRVDVCTKMTVNRLHEQPQFQKPELVRAVCDSSIPVFRRLCVRSGLRK